MGGGAAGDTGPAARSSFQESSGILVLRAVIFLDALRLAYPGNGRRGDGMRRGETQGSGLGGDPVPGAMCLDLLDFRLDAGGLPWVVSKEGRRFNAEV